MRILLVGSGGREHALATALSEGGKNTVYALPGNVGMEKDGIRIVPILATDILEICSFAKNEKIDFAVIGPDQALADGVVDALTAARIPTFGPTKAAAQIEASKAFAKKMMMQAKIPTADFRVVKDFSEAQVAIRETDWAGWVVKADGLALGKGVVVCRSREDALKAAKEFLAGSVGSAGSILVIEELLIGREVSGFYFCDGKSARELGFACDYKQLRDRGEGPNTGGMGSYSPVEWLPANFSMEVRRSVVEPLLAEMNKNATPFSGMLFVGVMVTEKGPKVLEFNARFGDPETQSLLPLLAEPIIPWLQASAAGNLDKFPNSIQRRNESAVHIVCAAYGYPGTEGIPVRKGDGIWVSDIFPADAKIYFAGVAKHANGLVTNGGRVLGVTVCKPTRAEARARAYEMIDVYVNFNQKQVRRDVGE